MQLSVKYQRLLPHLNEKQKRLYLASEALDYGYGGITQVHLASGISRVTITRGVQELKNNVTPDSAGRIRKVGGGKKKTSEKQPGLLTALRTLVAPATKGDPMTHRIWTNKSTRVLAGELQKQGYIISHRLVADLLHQEGYSLQANKKTIEGGKHPDRDKQFTHINKGCRLFEAAGNPIISVDCKKKELLGNFKHNGKIWSPKGKPTEVNVYDFTSMGEGKAIPYGIYDIVKNSGFINVGQDHDTASFAVESIRRWWKEYGRSLYTDKKEILIVADGGGSNGVKNRLWKRELQKFANEEQLTVTVSHLPPGTSKWNKIEHRLFSYISINWQAKPLISMETVIELISSTTTKTGLTVHAVTDTNTYPIKIKVTDKEMKKLNIIPDEFHGEWNYTIKPKFPKKNANVN